MALITDSINFDNVDKMVPPGPVPNGDYILAMIESDYKTSNSNPDNRYIDAVFQVMEGACKGRRIYIKYNVLNKNSVAESIGKSHYFALCEALGKNPKMVGDTIALHNIIFCAKVNTKVTKDQNGQDFAYNIITQYLPYGSAEAGIAKTNAAKPAPAWGGARPVQAVQPVPQQPIPPAAYQVPQEHLQNDEIPF
jgi:predicted metal-binding protein